MGGAVHGAGGADVLRRRGFPTVVVGHRRARQRNRVYPDFLACIENEGNGKFRFTVLETKGLHLKGSEDTEYKRRLLELLTEHSKTALSAGELKLNLEDCQIRFELLLEDNWRDKLAQQAGQA